MKIRRKKINEKGNWIWAFLNDNEEGGVRFSCPPGDLEETLKNCLQKSTEDFTFSE